MYTTKITVLIFVWYHLVFIQYSYYRDLFFSGPVLHLCNRHRRVGVRYTHTTKITVLSMSSLLLSIDIRQFYCFILFYFKLTNGSMDKWCMVKWCNREIKIVIGPFVSNKYWICSFVLFSNTTFLQQINQSMILIIWSLTSSTSTKCMLSKQATTKRQEFTRGQTIVVREILTLI